MRFIKYIIWRQKTLNLQFNDTLVMSVLFTVFPCKIIGENINTCPKSILIKLNFFLFFF